MKADKRVNKLLKLWSEDQSEELMATFEEEAEDLQQALSAAELEDACLALRRLAKVLFENGQSKVLRQDQSGWQDMETASVYRLFLYTVLGTSTQGNTVELALAILHLRLLGQCAEQMPPALAALEAAVASRDEFNQLVTVCVVLWLFNRLPSGSVLDTPPWSRLLSENTRQDEQQLKKLWSECAEYRLFNCDLSEDHGYEFAEFPFYPIELLLLADQFAVTFDSDHPLLVTPLTRPENATGAWKQDTRFADVLGLASLKQHEIASIWIV